MSSLTQESRTRILSQLRAEQSEGWQRGERVLVEELLTQYPAVADDAEVLLELVQSEILYRLKRGEPVSVEEYHQRFAGHIGKLSDLWAQLQKGAPTLDLEGGDLDNTVSKEPTRPMSARVLAAPTMPGFELREKLGQGGMGVVYRGRDLRLDQPRAIKFIRTGPLTNEEAYNRFNREAKAVARLDHPGVVRIFAQGEHGDTLYICMELLEGGSLHTRLRQGPFEIRAAADLVRQLALAIQHAHDNNVIHRDLKPSNVLLTVAGVPKVSDFGLAKLLDEQDDLTQAGAVLGTTGYMAPEQAEARLGEVRGAADIWALGVILYECLTGSLPFQGASRSETLEMVKNRQPSPLRQLRRDVPVELEAICLKCLQKQPAARYPSAGKLAGDLQAWLAGQPVHASIKAGRWRRWVVVGAALLLFAGLFGGAFLLAPNRRGANEVVQPPVPPPVDNPPPQPGVWNALLTREPTKLSWPMPGKSSYLRFLPETREMELSCEDLGLLSLGQTKAPRFQIEFSLKQNPWNGNFGIFFGCQPCTVDNKPGHRCQLLEILAENTENQGPCFRAHWLTATFKHRAGASLRKATVQMAASDLFRLPPVPHVLRLTVGPDGVASLSVGDNVLPIILPLDVPRPPATAYQGEFGIYVHSTVGVFRDAKYLFFEEP